MDILDRSTIETPRLQLRLVALRDAEALAAVSSGVIGDASEWIDAKLNVEATQLAHAIIERDGGKLVGAVQVSVAKGDPYHYVGLAYWIGPTHRGRGYATEAVLAALRHIAKPGMRPIYAWLGRDNYASARVLEKCGFKPVSDTPVKMPPETVWYRWPD